MKEGKCKIILHAFSFNENLTNPGYDEEGQPDIEFNDTFRLGLFFNCSRFIRAAFISNNIRCTKIAEDPQQFSVKYFNSDFSYELYIITDQKVWSPYTTQCKVSDSTRNGWSIHHIDLPDGNTIDHSRLLPSDIDKLKRSLLFDLHKHELI